MRYPVRTLAAEHERGGTECEAERDKLKLEVLDLNQQLVLAGTETVQDRSRPCAPPCAPCFSLFWSRPAGGAIGG